MNDDEVRRLINEAAERGAKKALREIGLHDEYALDDLREIRGLLDAWRETKRTVGQTVARLLTTAILTALAAGVWMNWGDK
jgi:2-iminoacetate synthase ThiH